MMWFKESVEKGTTLSEGDEEHHVQEARTAHRKTLGTKTLRRKDPGNECMNQRPVRNAVRNEAAEWTAKWNAPDPMRSEGNDGSLAGSSRGLQNVTPGAPPRFCY